MQRQAVPLLRAETPYVGTGNGAVTARDSGAVVICKRAGIVDSVDSERIICAWKATSTRGSSRARWAPTLYAHQVQALQSEHLHQPEADRAAGTAVKKGEVLADGPCTDSGELASAGTCWWPSCPARL